MLIVRYAGEQLRWCVVCGLRSVFCDAWKLMDQHDNRSYSSPAVDARCTYDPREGIDDDHVVGFWLKPRGKRVGIVKLLSPSNAAGDDFIDNDPSFT